MGNTYETSYGRPTPVEIKVPAEMLETVSGYEDEARLDRELDAALDALEYEGETSYEDADSLRWIVALLEVKLGWLDSCPDCEPGAVCDQHGRVRDA